MLLVVAHPVVGSGLEILLRLEDRYDGALLRDAGSVSLGAPALVLSGSPVDAAGLQQGLDDPRGWLRKDPTPEELRAAITGVLAWGFLALRPTG